jgi:diguanylate cyclase (GGDEF)-like protein
MDEPSNNNDLTVIIQAEGIKKRLAETENEAKTLPGALLAIGGALNGTIFDLKSTELSAGRSNKNAIHLNFSCVSRLHFKLFKVSDDWFIEDVQSKNGTYVNNTLIKSPTQLKRGDIIKVVNIALKYLPHGDSERLAYDKLTYIANTDGHTGCFTKCYFNDKLEEEFLRCRTTGQELSLIILDLDYFKNINDQFGHDAGDYILKEVADIVRVEGVRSHDIFARYGGEEFGILLPKTGFNQAMTIAERIRVLIQNHSFNYGAEEISVTASLGVADYNKEITNAKEFFIRADNAAYEAKALGRNQVSSLIYLADN